MKLATNEMDAETDKWQENSAGTGTAPEENNDIVKRAKNMSSMAFSMYQFTKGEGDLKTTQDLFTQAEYFAEEANRLYKVIRQFSYQVSTDLQTTNLEIIRVAILITRCQVEIKRRNYWNILIRFQPTCNGCSLALRTIRWAKQQRLRRWTT